MFKEDPSRSALPGFSWLPPWRHRRLRKTRHLYALAPVPARNTPLRGSRYYANSLWKLTEAADVSNREEVDFAIALGDALDRHV